MAGQPLTLWRWWRTLPLRGWHMHAGVQLLCKGAPGQWPKAVAVAFSSLTAPTQHPPETCHFPHPTHPPKPGKARPHSNNTAGLPQDAGLSALGANGTMSWLPANVSLACAMLPNSELPQYFLQVRHLIPDTGQCASI